MNRRSLAFFVSTLSVLTLGFSGCGGTAVQPTKAAIPPTATVLLPTATPTSSPGIDVKVGETVTKISEINFGKYQGTRVTNNADDYNWP